LCSPDKIGSKVTWKDYGDDVEEVIVQEDKFTSTALSWKDVRIIPVYKVQLNKSFSSCLFTSLLSELYRNILVGHFHEPFD